MKNPQWSATCLAVPGNKLVAVFWRICIVKKIKNMKEHMDENAFLVSSTSKTTMPIMIHIFPWKLRALLEKIFLNIPRDCLWSQWFSWDLY